MLKTGEFSCKGFSGWRVQTLSPDLLERLMPGEQGESPNKGEVILRRHGRKIIRVSLGICLKIYPPEQQKAESAWQTAFFLEERNIPTPPPLFWGLHKSGYGVYASKWIGGTTSWPVYFQRLSASERQAFLPHLAHFVNLLHQSGIYHRDLSHWNILLDQRGQLYLVDLDDVRILSKVSFRRRFRNLIQIFCSALEVCSLEERKALFGLYWQRERSFLFFLLEWLARRRQKHIAKKYRKKYGKKYSALT